MITDSTTRLASIAGWVFAVTFFVGLFSVGDQAGAFADSDRAYAELFADTSHRVFQDLTGSVLLIVSAIAFGVSFNSSLQPSTRASRAMGGLWWCGLADCWPLRQS